MFCAWVQPHFEAKLGHSRVQFHSWSKTLCLSKPNPLGGWERTSMVLGLKCSVHSKISIWKSPGKGCKCKWKHYVIDFFFLMGPREKVQTQAIPCTYKLLTGVVSDTIFSIQINPFSSRSLSSSPLTGPSYCNQHLHWYLVGETQFFWGTFKPTINRRVPEIQVVMMTLHHRKNNLWFKSDVPFCSPAVKSHLLPQKEVLENDSAELFVLTLTLRSLDSDWERGVFPDQC